MDDRRRIPRVDGTKVGNMADALRIAGFALELIELNGDQEKLSANTRTLVISARETVMNVQQDIWNPTPPEMLRAEHKSEEDSEATTVVNVTV